MRWADIRKALKIQSSEGPDCSDIKKRKAAGKAALECRCVPVEDHAGATAEPRVSYGIGVSASTKNYTINLARCVTTLRVEGPNFPGATGAEIAATPAA